MITIGILGAGDIGGAAAHAIARSECASKLILVDEAEGVAAGKALDIRQAGAVEGFHTRLEGTRDLDRTLGCAVWVIADRHGQPSTEWHGDEVLALLARSVPFMGEAPIVFAGAAQGGAIVAAWREGGVRRERLVGSAPGALAAAIAAIVAMEAHCSAAEVHLTVLGRPPGGFVVPWSDASIGGYALETVLTPVQMARIDARAARLWPPGPFALGLAAARAASAVVESSRRAITALTILSGELGFRGSLASMPVLLSPAGIVHTRVPSLNTRDRVRLETVLAR